MEDSKKKKEKIIAAGEKAVDELIKVIKQPIIEGKDDDPNPEKLKNAAATKKLAVFDAFEILERIDLERDKLEGVERKDVDKSSGGFAENNAR